MRILISLFALLFTTQVFGLNLDFCNDKLGNLPIQQGGRVKPLYVHARETIKYMTEKSKVGDTSAITAYCLLSFDSMGVENKVVWHANIQHHDLRKFLELGDEKKTTFENLISNKNELIVEWRKQKEETSYKKSLDKVLRRMQLYEEIKNGANWKLYDKTGPEGRWLILPEFLKEDKVLKAKESSTNPFEAVLFQSEKDYVADNGDDFRLELTFAKMRLTLWALLLSLLGLGSLVLTKKNTWPLGFAFTTVAVQTVYLTLRVMISGRAPITNMYETVLFSGYAALILALIVGHFKKERQYIYVGLAYNFLSIMMINFSGGMLSSSISPLVPVLRDNFWLSTHVTTIIISYGALALSWILANTALIKARFAGGMSKEEMISYTDQIYTCLKYGIILLAAGIILGGVWADYSWGRFWGWDPKETWSLIVLCLYMAILHGKYTSWISPARFIPLNALAFLSVMMAWFGVNYILASGLHSYGFSEGGAIFLGSFFLIQFIILGLTTKSFLEKFDTRRTSEQIQENPA
jgi:cytochrome c-type biogenesis protein CcsB